MGARDHRQRKQRGPKTPSSRNVTINGYRIQKVGDQRAPQFFSYDVVARSSVFSQSPLIQGNHRDPNSHSYTKTVRVSPVATVGYMRSDIPYINESSGPVQSQLQFWSYLWKNTENPYAFGVTEATVKKASHKFFSQLRSSSANLAVDIAELNQSRDMIAKRCKQLSRIGRELKRLTYRWWKNLQWNRKNPKHPPRWVPPQHRKAENPIDIVTATWLEWKLGWSPLLGSIFGVLGHQKESAKTFRVKANTKTLFRRNFPKNITEVGYGSFVASADVEVSCYCTWCADYTNTSPLLYDTNRLTSLNPAPIIWELVPFSFVLDYFVNVGRWLEELETSFHAGLTFKRGYDVTVTRYLNKIRVPDQSRLQISPPGQYYQRGIADGKEYEVRKVRTKWLSTPLPFAPGWEPKIGAERLFTLASLFQQLFFSKGAFR